MEKEEQKTEKRRMAKWLKVTLITLGSLLGAAVVAFAVVLWLVFTPSQLTKIVNKLSANYVTCDTYFENVDLTLFSTFPDAGLRIENVCIVNPKEGAPSDTVACIGSLTVGVDIKKYIKEKEVVVHQVLLDDVRAELFIDRAGGSNFDIFPKSDDTTTTAFSLDSLPTIDLRKVAISNLSARLISEKDSMRASVDGLDMDVVGSLKEGSVEADVDLEVDCGGLKMASGEWKVENGEVRVKGKGNSDNVEGTLALRVKNGECRVGERELINEALRNSKKELLTLEVPFKADLQRMHLELDKSKVAVDDYALGIEGDVQLKTDELPLGVDLAVWTDKAWRVAPLLEIVPEQYTSFKKGMDVDGDVSFSASVAGAVTDSVMPLILAKVDIADGKFYYPKALPYKFNKISADISAPLQFGKNGHSTVYINNVKAHTRGTDVSLNGTIEDLTGDMAIGVALKATMPLADAMPMVPEKMHLAATGKADIDISAAFKMSQINNREFEKIKADVDARFNSLDVTYDTIHATSPNLAVHLQLPSKEHKGKLADTYLKSGKLNVEYGKSVNAKLEDAEIDLGLNNPMCEQLAADYDIKLGETEVGMDSMLFSLEALKLKGSMRMDSTQDNPLRKFNPTADILLHSAVMYMPALPDAVRLSEFALKYDRQTCDLKSVEVKLGHSDFQLYGTVDNLEPWLDHKQMLHADLNFTSSYADIDQLMSLVSGIGTDADSLEQMRDEDHVSADANPFIVPKDVDLTLHTHIKRSVAFGNDLNDVAGSLTVKDGVAILDQIGFVCKAATMQLSALYRSPRPNNLFCALDFHLLDIQIDELLDMIPVVDTLVPMLAAFNGNANFHLAAETFLNARYQPKMSSLLGSAAISGRDLTVLDNNTIAQVAKFMQFKSWKDKDNKIKIDSLDVEMTCFRKEIEVYPFLLNIGKYQICASGKHTLDNQCSYHVELLKNPLLAKVGVDIRGNIAKPSVSLGKVRYADLFKPEKQGVVEKRTLELKHMIREALEKNVR